MAEKSAKKKSKKRSDASVLGSLSPTRPTRLGGERRAATTRATAPKPAKPPKPGKPKTAKSRATKPKPAATRTPPAGWQVPGEGAGRRDHGRAGVATTAVQAAGELAQIGLTIGGQMLKRAARRIPRS